MEEKGRAELYLDLLTHDINNYITAALGYLQLARCACSSRRRTRS